ncbi:MAG: rhodanese-like domain-containing protein [Ferruginibacter sp.]
MQFKKQFFFLAFILFTAVISFGQSIAYKKMLDTLLQHTVKEISPTEVAAKKKTILLDARPAKEYNVSHLQNAIRVGFTDFSFDKLRGIKKTTAIIVYCSVGYRSEKITEKLNAAGYTNVQNMVGGIFEWANEGRPLKDSTGFTKNVHAYNEAWGKWLLKGNKVY